MKEKDFKEKIFTLTKNLNIQTEKELLSYKEIVDISNQLDSLIDEYFKTKKEN